jgi:WD40 repeat protein
VGVSAALVYALEGWGQAADQRDRADREADEARQAQIQEAGQRRRADGEAREARQAQAKEAEQRRQADAARRQAVGDRLRAEDALAYSWLAQARLEWRLNNLPGAAALLENCPPSRRGWEWRYLKGLHHTDLLTLANAHPACVYSVAFHPDGKVLASAGGNPYRREPDGRQRSEVKVWDARDGRLLHTLDGLAGMARRVAYSPDGKLLAATVDGVVRLWTAADGKPQRSLGGGRRSPDDLAFSPDGKSLAAASVAGFVVLWDVATGKELRRLSVKARPSRLAYRPDGKHLAVGCLQPAGVQVWDVEAGRVLFQLSGDVRSLAYSPDGALLAIAGNGVVRLADANTGQVHNTLGGHDGRVAAVAFSPDGRTLATAGADSTVRLWDVRGARQRGVWRGHLGRAECLAFHPSGRALASGGSQPGDVKVWDLTRPAEHLRLEKSPHGSAVEAVGFDPTGVRVLVQQRGGLVQVRDTVSGRILLQRRLPLAEAWMVPGSQAAFAAGRWLAAVSPGQNAVTVWDITTGQPAGSFRHGGVVLRVALDRAGKRVASCAPIEVDGQVWGEWAVWEAATGRALFRARARDTMLDNLALSADGRFLAVLTTRLGPERMGPSGRQRLAACEVLVWEVRPAGQPVVRRAYRLGAPARAVALGGDGKVLAVAAVSGQVALWDLASGRPLHRQPLQGPGMVEDLAFSPDGRLLAGVNREQVKVWEVGPGREVLTLRGARPRPGDLALNPRVTWSADGKRLAATNWDGSISVWEDADLASPAGKAALRRAAEERALGWHLAQARRYRDQGDRPALALHLKALADLPARDPEMLRERGRLYARSGLWERAAADYARAFALAPPHDVAAWREQALVCLKVGDRAGYRRLCGLLLERCGGTPSAQVAAEVALTCAAAPGAVADPREPLRLARQAVREQPEVGLYRHALALACYRAGLADEGTRAARTALEPGATASPPEVLSWLALALTLRQAGAAEAPTWRDRAERRLAAEEEQAARQGESVPRQLSWSDWVMAQQLRAELRPAAVKP